MIQILILSIVRIILFLNYKLMMGQGKREQQEPFLTYGLNSYCPFCTASYIRKKANECSQSHWQDGGCFFDFVIYINYVFAVGFNGNRCEHGVLCCSVAISVRSRAFQEPQNGASTPFRGVVINQVGGKEVTWEGQWRLRLCQALLSLGAVSPGQLSSKIFCLWSSAIVGEAGCWLGSRWSSVDLCSDAWFLICKSSRSGYDHQ